MINNKIDTVKVEIFFAAKAVTGNRIAPHHSGSRRRRREKIATFTVHAKNVFI